MDSEKDNLSEKALSDASDSSRNQKSELGEFFYVQGQAAGGGGGEVEDGGLDSKR